MSDRSYIVLRSDFQSFSKVAGNYKELRSGGQSSACQEIANYFKIANKFNNYLHSALSLEAYILLQAANLVISMGDLSCSQGVFACLPNISPKNFTWPNGISSTSFSRYAESSRKCSQILFSKSATSGKFSAEGEITNLLPVLKSGSTTDVKKYGPSCFFRTVCKMLDGFIFKPA